MAARADRVDALLGKVRRARRLLVTPEGVELTVEISGIWERLSAFFLDAVFMHLAIILLVLLALPLFDGSTAGSVAMTLMLFVAFVVRNCYFIHFELAWQGRTPGKRICGLRVIDRKGGELTPGAVIARNLTREVEFFLPLAMLFALGDSSGFWADAALLGWVAIIASLPLWNRERLRVGDLIGGTQVIVAPKRLLLPDLTVPSFNWTASAGTGRKYSFTPQHLAVYGAFELQVLEELLRRSDSGLEDAALTETCRKICRKIAWPEIVPLEETRRFLEDFYAAERAELERSQLFGHCREDQFDRS